MSYELFWNFAFNILFNSFLSFFTVSLFVLAGLSLFRVHEPRFRALILCLPFLKLGFDFFLYDFSSWALNHQINPLEAEPGSRILSAMMCFPFFVGWIPLFTRIQLFMFDGITFTLADLLTFCIDPFWIKVVVSVSMIISITLLGLWLKTLFLSTKRLSNIVKNAVPCYRPIFNQSLSYALVKSRIEIFISSEIFVPCALGFFQKKILFPATLIDDLSHEEFEAIIVHELDHLNWNDAFIRTLINFFRMVFWWIPTKWCLSRIEQCQEYACDKQIRKFNIGNDHLASAILKAAQSTKYHSDCMMLNCFVNKYSMTHRVKAILDESKTGQWLILKIMKNVLAAVFMLAILFGKFWIF
jgi:Zn-dependent protease with chaperone function